MNHPKVKAALNVPDDDAVEWAGCIPGGGRRRRRRLGLLDNDKPVSVVPYVAELLDQWQIRVLVYNGDMDMSTNAAGSEMLLNKMEWSGHTAWKVAARGVWMLRNNTVAGYVKKYADLTFLVVKNSGHLVPLNRPVQALDLIERFLRNQPFWDIPLPSFVLSASSSQAALQELQTQDMPSEGSLDYNRAPKGQWEWVIAQCGIVVVSFAAGVLAAFSWRRHGYETIKNSPIIANL
jgi:Serine carboxypeptidase